MRYDPVAREIYIDKTLNELDLFTLDFIRVLEKYEGYVLVSGYVSILLGRSRASEDVDLLVPEMPLEKFSLLFEDLTKQNFECANTSFALEAFEALDHYAIRFYKEVPVPNMEFKKISNDIHRDAFENRLKVIFGNNTLYISPLELQIAYKLSLMAPGKISELHSDKDFEDAKHIYETFKEKIDEKKILGYVTRFNCLKIWETFKHG